jgi:hypothetical protein
LPFPSAIRRRDHETIRHLDARSARRSSPRWTRWSRQRVVTVFRSRPFSSVDRILAATRASHSRAYEIKDAIEALLPELTIHRSCGSVRRGGAQAQARIGTLRPPARLYSIQTL